MRVDEQIGVVVTKLVFDFAYDSGIENLTGCLLYELLHSKVLAIYRAHIHVFIVSFKIQWAGLELKQGEGYHSLILSNYNV